MALVERKFATMATFPKRVNNLERVILSIAGQVDEIHICLNEFEAVPDFLVDVPNAFPHIPELDYKDVGKFIFEFSKDDIIFTVDDDIIYPRNYVEFLSDKLNEYRDIKAIVGVHGVTYSDVFDGAASSRSVQTFNLKCHHDFFVNQLGTGTTCFRGVQAPTKQFMIGSQGFVDVRFARHAYENEFPMIVLERETNWMEEIAYEGSLFEEVTQKWDPKITREVNTFGGFSNLKSFLPASQYLAMNF